MTTVPTCSTCPSPLSESNIAHGDKQCRDCAKRWAKAKPARTPGVCACGSPLDAIAIERGWIWCRPCNVSWNERKNTPLPAKPKQSKQISTGVVVHEGGAPEPLRFELASPEMAALLDALVASSKDPSADVVVIADAA